jgi:hypothetical protein
MVLWRRRGVVLKTVLFVRGRAARIRPLGNRESADSPMERGKVQVARRTDSRAKIVRCGCRRHGGCSVHNDCEGAEAGDATSGVVTFYKRGHCRINRQVSRRRDAPPPELRTEKAAFPLGFPQTGTPPTTRQRGRGFQPTLASAGTLLLDAAAETNASISCMSSEMFPSFSGCHCTPVTHHE